MTNSALAATFGARLKARLADGLEQLERSAVHTLAAMIANPEPFRAEAEFAALPADEQLAELEFRELERRTAEAEDSAECEACDDAAREPEPAASGAVRGIDAAEGTPQQRRRGCRGGRKRRRRED
jgi:hypothetical protein